MDYGLTRNDIGNYKGSSTLSRNFMNFGPQTVKIEPEALLTIVHSAFCFIAGFRTHGVQQTEL